MKPEKKIKIAVGVFDGVHKGHQKVIEKAHLVISFDPHPNKAVHLLTTPAERQDLIGNIKFIKFNKKISQMSPEDFVKMLVKKFHPESICVGHDFAFGYNREGNVQILRQLGEKYGFIVEEIPEVFIDGIPVRSSAIRKLLAKGDIAQATEFLGREYQVSGKIVHGVGRGKTLGFPTINVCPDHPDKLLPLEGVYAGEVILEKKIYRCAIFIGECESFGETKKVLEAHILNFNGNVYGKKCTLFFKNYLRPVQKFANQEALKNQIRQDIASLQAK